VGLRNWLRVRIVRFMTKSVAHYPHYGHNDFEALRKHIRKGDVLLVEGDQRVSVVIKYLTQSSWSHAALYVGDELVRRGGELAAFALESFGDDAHDLIIEALYDGVVASPLDKYVEFNVRLCRPHQLRADHLRIILDDAIEAIGWRYDLRNMLELAVRLPLASLLPRRFRLEDRRLGSGLVSAVICTSLLGRLFRKVRFPVLPTVSFPEEEEVQVVRKRRFGLFPRRRRRARGIYRPRHPTLITPRDFDVSPYFEIIKFNAIGNRDFDYVDIRWADELPEASEQPES
jgi:hypothetical protein